MEISVLSAEILHFDRRRTIRRKRKASAAERRQMLFRAFYVAGGAVCDCVYVWLCLCDGGYFYETID